MAIRKYNVFLVLFIFILLAGCNFSFLEPITSTSQETSSSSEPTEPTEDTDPHLPGVGVDCQKAWEQRPDGWIPIWCEEFDYTGLPDETKWYIEHKGDGFGNEELQYYTPREENVYVENGYLRITVRKEYYLGRHYTSGKLMSVNRGDFLYGRIEIRAKLPEGKGTWPAFWMMPTDSVYGHWPKSGEIDIMEHVGYDPNRIHGTIHTENYNHMYGTQKGNSIVVDDVFNTYHVYAIEWGPTSIKWFVDGIQYFEFKNDRTTNPNASSANWPFDQKFYVILNVAFGGTWGGARGIDPNFVESSMYVDYVRVYQKDYETLDVKAPEPVSGYLLVSSSPEYTKVIWNYSEDDTGVSHFEVYLNGDYVGQTRANRYEFRNLTQGKQYSLLVVAVDFTGKRSEPTLFKFTVV